MTQIVLAVAWYSIPKGIDCAVSRFPSLQSRMDRILTKIFTYQSKSIYLNTCIKYTFVITSAVVSHMWLVLLIALATEKITSIADPTYGFIKVAICYAVFSIKTNTIKLINSNWMLDFITSEFGLKCANPLGLFLINRCLKKSYLSGELDLLDILNKRLDASSTQKLLETQRFPPLTHFTVIERIKLYRYLESKIGCSMDYYRRNICDIDPILSKISCPILGGAPQDLTTDPTDKKTIYDSFIFAIYLQYTDISPITGKKIPQDFDAILDGGGRYECILNYRKACLQSKELQDPKEFIANLKEVFAEILTLDSARDIKKASKKVCDFFQKGFLSTYDAQYFTVEPQLINAFLEQKTELPHALGYIKKGLKPQPYKTHKYEHRLDQYDINNPLASKAGFIAVSIDDFENYPFIENELALEIEKIKTTGQELIQAFL